MNAKCKKCGKDLYNTNIILEVKPDSESAKLGLQTGDQIVVVDGKEIKDIKETDKILKPFLVHSVVLKRQGKDITVDVENLKDFFEAIIFIDKSITVQSTKKDSVATKLGIIQKDEIISVDSKSIATQEDIVKTYKPHTIIIKRQENEISYNVENLTEIFNDLVFKEGTLTVKEVKKESEAAKIGLLAGDTILTKKFEKQDELQKVTKPKEYQITVLRNKEKKEFLTNDIISVLQSITLKPEEICSSCGAKQKKSILIPILICCLLLLGLSIGLFFIMISPRTDVGVNKSITTVQEELPLEKEENSPFIFSEEFEALLDAELEAEILSESENGSEVASFQDEPVLSSEVEESKDGEKKRTQNRKGRGDKTSGAKTNGQANEKTVGTPPFTPPKIPSDWTKKLSYRIYFNYGSSVNYLNKMEGSIEILFNGITDSKEKKEFSNIVKALEDLISRVDVEKRNDVMFYIEGFADSTFRGAIPTDSDESQLYNTKLSLDRANSIKALLTSKEFNIAENKIVVTPHGYNVEEEKKYPLWTFRRVDIFVTYKD